MFRTDTFQGVGWCFWKIISALEEEMLVISNSILLLKSINFGHHNYFMSTRWEQRINQALNGVIVLKLRTWSKAKHSVTDSTSLVFSVGSRRFQWALFLTNSHWYSLAFILWYSIEIKFGLVKIGLKELPKILFPFALFHISYFMLKSVNVLT